MIYTQPPSHNIKTDQVCISWEHKNVSALFSFGLFGLLLSEENVNTMGSFFKENFFLWYFILLFFFFCYPELQFHYLSGSHHNANFQVVSVNKHFWSASGAFCGWHLGVTDVKTPNPQGVCNIFTIKPLDAYKISCKPFKMLFFPLNLHKHNVRV